jgi:serine/threonine-protein kinase
MIKTWQEKYRKGERIGKGGQGLTYFVNDLKTDNQYAIKFLKEQKNIERRERMFIEISALKVLVHPFIPKLIDSNEDKFKNTDHELFMVNEYIPGSTLQDYILENGVMSFNQAIDFTIKTSGIIDFCHSKGFIHRDIKPDNIIVKDNDIAKPYLIDFGLSFNTDISANKNNTPSWQHLGNRFLSLPELRVSEGNKRDTRSDITMVCGILLFCLTGVHPTDLVDENMAKPHRRAKEKSVIDKIEDYRRPSINNFFDIAFNQGINDRWQSIKTVIHTLTEIGNMKPNDDKNIDINQKLEKFKAEFESRHDYKQLEQIQLLFSKCSEIINNAAQDVRNKLLPVKFGTIQTGHNIDIPKQVFRNQLGIKSPYSNEVVFYPKFTCYSNGSEFIFESTESNQRTELARLQLNKEIDWNDIKTKIVEYYINGITEK